jgi:predicted anti-sigma-YlaC factor YlaD
MKNRPNMTIDDALTCQEVVELVTEYLENALLPEMRKRLEEHVAECPGCAAYIEQVRLTVIEPESPAHSWLILTHNLQTEVKSKMSARKQGFAK